MQLRKGEILQIKKPLTFNFGSDSDEQLVTFEKGIRAILTKGGSKPSFILAYVHGASLVSFSGNHQLLKEHFEPAEPHFESKIDGLNTKHVQEIQGQETRCFTFDITYKGKNVGYAQNNGCGEENHLNIVDANIRKNVKELVAETAKKIGERESFVAECFVGYLLDGFHRGFLSFEQHMRLQQTCLSEYGM